MPENAGCLENTYKRTIADLEADNKKLSDDNAKLSDDIAKLAASNSEKDAEITRQNVIIEQLQKQIAEKQ